MKPDWRKLSWKVVRPILIRFLLSVSSKITGPLGWALLNIGPFIIDNVIKKYWNMATRSIAKKKNIKKGIKRAKEIRDVSTDNVDDIYDNMDEL